MNGPYKEEYWEAAMNEYKTLIRFDAWEVVDKDPWMNTLPSTWAFKCKRYPDGTMRNFKARFCARETSQFKGLNNSTTMLP